MREKICLTLLVALIVSTIHIARGQPLERYEYESPHMGTNFSIIFYADEDSVAEIAAEEAFHKIKKFDDILSDYKEHSELNRLSQKAGSSRWLPVSSPLYHIISTAQSVAKKTDGAFDITVGPFVQLWRKINRTYNPDLPSPDTLKKFSKHVGYQHIQVDNNRQRVKLLQPHMQLDPGGIAKGFAADRALKVLDSHGIHSALIDAGGDIVMGDPPPHKEGWKVTIQGYSTEGERQNIPLLLSNKAVATSGDLFNYVTIQGQHYSHIIDPRTGMGLTNQRKVTIIASNGITADSYASAVSVLKHDEGIQFVIRSSNLEGFIETRQNDLIHRKATPGFNRLRMKKR